MRRFKYYLKIFWIFTKNSIVVVLSKKFMFSFFIIGKIVRFLLFISFLYFLVKNTNGIAGYSSNQALFFFLVFNLVDVLGQLFFREAYKFRSKIISGDFDLTLIKPINPLFSSLFGGVDLLDLITLPPLLFATWWVASLLSPSLSQIFIFILLIINSFIISTAIHILVLAFGVIYLEVDHTIMLFREITSFGRFPIDIYKEPLKGIFTYMIPVGVMITFPAKAMMGLLSLGGIIFSLSIGLTILLISFRIWKMALLKYSSASS